MVYNRLLSMTRNFKWGVVSGQIFSCDFDTFNPDTKYVCEYEFSYKVKDSTIVRSFHILIFNKDGHKITELEKIVTIIGKNRIFSFFWKGSFIILMVSCFLSLSTFCHSNQHNHNPERSERN